ncbi:MAG: hypothetical protein ACW981_02495 [Candidatus Hodarchaeales archaeon]|jgi:hypothetical protein
MFNITLKQQISVSEILIIAFHAFIGWFLCGATMGIGQATTTIENALIIHALAAPIIFFLVSAIYFSKFNYTSPLLTAIIFILFVIVVDFFLVAMIIEQSFEMFYSPLGTWIPFVLMFLSTWLTGTWITKKNHN